MVRCCKFDDVVEQIGHGDGDGLLGIAVEAERLAGDVGGALEFLLGEAGIVAGLLVEGGVIAQQVEGVGDGFQGIVDFVGDDAGDAAHGGELFGLAQGLLGLKLRGDVALDFEDGVAFAIEDLAGGNDDLAAVAGVACTRLPSQDGGREGPASVSALDTGKTGAQELVEVAAEDFLAVPAVESLGAGIPEADGAARGRER